MAKGFRITGTTFDDDRIKLIESLPSGDETLVIYFRILSLACKSEAGGLLLIGKDIPYSDEMLATIFGRSIARVRYAITTLIQFKMIEETDSGIQVSEFEKWFIEEVKEVPKQKEKTELLPEPDKKKKKVYGEDSEEMKLSKYLFQLMRQNNPEAKEPNFQVWANEIRLMIERDSRKPDQIKNMIDWCQKDSFWKGNILSTKKLRDKYDQLKVRALEDWNKQQGQNRGGRQADIDDMFSRLLEGGNTNDVQRRLESN